MSGISGFVNFEKDLSGSVEIIQNMNNCLSKKCFNKEEDDYYIEKHSNFTKKRLLTKSLLDNTHSINYKINNNTYILLFNGRLYNKKELKEELIQNGFSFDTSSEIELIIKCFIHFGYDIVNKLNGIFGFAIWDSKKQELFIARDHLGVKPFYYSIVNENFIFSSEIKSILEHPDVTAKIDRQGICELFGLGPAHTPGSCAFKDIHELKPAHFAIYNKSGIHINQYWKLVSKQHTKDLKETCDDVKYLLEDSIQRQLICDVPLCTFLSGGLDSSIITLYASNYRKKQNMPPLDTYSVDYLNNDENFVKSDFQPNSDGYYIDIMTKKLDTNHHRIVLDTPELADALEDAMLARDLPGMADVDSSLLLFCKNVKQDATVTLTGECADELFGGYPWFFREDALDSNTFPWSIAISERQKLLNKDISSKVDLKEYVDFRYKESLDNVELLDTDSKETKEKRKISYLTLNWFMQTLLDRSDRMSMYNGFEIRVPFCDYRLAQYVWNIPWEMKALNGREKGLLRYIMEDSLPEEIVYRKKSPYPKTHNPTYLNKAKGMLTEIMSRKDAPIHNILNREYILNILQTNGSSFTRPWFGQLMTGPQLMAYLIQVNMWLEKYQPKIEL